MTKSQKEKCLEKCYFMVENCEQNEDGTWDCPADQQGCEERCRSFRR